MKQTEVEWLIEQLVVMDKQLDGRRKNEDATVMKMNPTKIVDQAKEMEKQQIIDAFNNGYYQETIGYNASEQYYNETFNK